MTALILDGKAVAAQIKAELSKEVAELRAKSIIPGLGTLLVGDDPGSKAYVAGKHRDCAEIGIESIRIDLPQNSSEADVRKAISELNSSTKVTGFIVQLPLPGGMPTNELLEMVNPDKDADGLHPMNLGKLVMGVNSEIRSPLPCTPAGIVELLKRSEVNLAGAKVAIIGRGLTVGRPLGLLLATKSINATVLQLHSASKNLAEEVRSADVVVAALGQPHFVKPEWIKPGAAVLDVGITRTASGLVGDVDPEVQNVAGYFSPNPGGVGPMTRAMLLSNVVKLAKTSI